MPKLHSGLVLVDLGHLFLAISKPDEYTSLPTSGASFSKSSESLYFTTQIVVDAACSLAIATCSSITLVFAWPATKVSWYGLAGLLCLPPMLVPEWALHLSQLFGPSIPKYQSPRSCRSFEGWPTLPSTLTPTQQPPWDSVHSHLPSPPPP